MASIGSSDAAAARCLCWGRYRQVEHRARRDYLWRSVDSRGPSGDSRRIRRPAPGRRYGLGPARSHEQRALHHAEHDELVARQEPLGRPTSTRAALIPIKKSEAWWELAQDERRRIFEESSRHVASGLEYLPRVARRLHHGRDLGEPFDFLTWFEFAPEDAAGFEELVQRLRASEEWNYVEREIDIRLAREVDTPSR